MGDSEGKGRVAMFCVVCEEEEEESTKKEGALLETSPAFQKKQLHSPPACEPEAAPTSDMTPPPPKVPPTPKDRQPEGTATTSHDHRPIILYSISKVLEQTCCQPRPLSPPLPL